MKLLLCLECNHIFNLSYREKSCSCGKIKGQYIDKLNAVYSGDSAVPLGIDNYSLARAIKYQPEEGLGERFVAFTIPKRCPTLVKVGSEVSGSE